MELNTHFNNCQGLDMVEKAIKKIKETVFQADSVFQDVHKRFYFLKRHGITVRQEQIDIYTYICIYPYLVRCNLSFFKYTCNSFLDSIPLKILYYSLIRFDLRYSILI